MALTTPTQTVTFEDTMCIGSAFGFSGEASDAFHTSGGGVVDATDAVDFKFPVAHGPVSSYLTTDGSGNMTWVDFGAPVLTDFNTSNIVMSDPEYAAVMGGNTAIMYRFTANETHMSLPAGDAPPTSVFVSLSYDVRHPTTNGGDTITVSVVRIPIGVRGDTDIIATPPITTDTLSGTRAGWTHETHSMTTTTLTASSTTTYAILVSQVGAGFAATDRFEMRAVSLTLSLYE